jgi:hypothetical protein
MYGDHPQPQTVQLEAALTSHAAVLDSTDPLAQLHPGATGRATGHATTTDRPPRSARRSRTSSTRHAVVGWSADAARDADVHELAIAR